MPFPEPTDTLSTGLATGSTAKHSAHGLKDSDAALTSGSVTETSAKRKRDPKPSRAGRNLPLATAFGLGLLAVVIISIILSKEVFAGLVFIAVCLALWELGRALQARGLSIPLLPLFVGSAGIIVSALTTSSEAMFVSFMLTVVGVVLWRTLDGGGVEGLRDAAAGTFAVAYLPLMAGFVMLLIAADDGAARVLLFLLLVVASDTGGYAAGVLFGRHPMAPGVSPKKSWEGFAGSMFLASAVAVPAVVFIWDEPYHIGFIIAVGTVLTATMGDLAESLIKRDLGIKDMGSLIPGHGGILDRLDSLLMAAPVCYILFTILLPVTSFLNAGA